MIKRAFDLFASLTGLLLLSPFFLLIALWIILDSGFPVFYLQSRVGKGGKDFRLCKFRTMRRDSDSQGLLTIGKDKRITSCGRFLRKYKLDELPQLWNVLLGEMSLVGPRPEVRKYVEMYSEEQKKILSFKPGITDMASIEYADENRLLGQSADPEKTYVEVVMPGKLRLSLAYMEKAGFFSDLGIIMKTLVRVIR